MMQICLQGDCLFVSVSSAEGSKPDIRDFGCSTVLARNGMESIIYCKCKSEDLIIFHWLVCYRAVHEGLTSCNQVIKCYLIQKGLNLLGHGLGLCWLFWLKSPFFSYAKAVNWNQMVLYSIAEPVISSMLLDTYKMQNHSAVILSSSSRL